MTSTHDRDVVQRRSRRLGRAVLYAVVVAAVVMAIGLLVRERFDPLLDADNAAIRAMTGVTRRHPGLRTALIAWQEMSQPTNLYLVATMVCLWMWLRKGYTSRAWWAFVTMMLAWNIQLLAKLTVQRARPVVQDAVSHAPGYSFPSGHAANAAAATTAVVVLLWPVLGPVGRRVAAGLAAAFTVVTALDRTFLGVHFPSDVVAGIVLGCGLVTASFAGYRGWSPGEEPAHSHGVGDIEVPDAPAASGPPRTAPATPAPPATSAPPATPADRSHP